MNKSNAVAIAFSAAATALRVVDGITPDTKLAWTLTTMQRVCESAGALVAAYPGKAELSFLRDAADELETVLGTLPEMTPKNAQRISSGVLGAILYVQALVTK